MRALPERFMASFAPRCCHSPYADGQDSTEGEASVPLTAVATLAALLAAIGQGMVDIPRYPVPTRSLKGDLDPTWCRVGEVDSCMVWPGRCSWCRRR